ncbi:MAG: glycine oxidase ThiO, partial [Acidimicrobiales bacterium]
MGTTAVDVVIVGGGVIGLSVAWEAASAGMSVSVIDPRPGHGATWAAAGMLAPVGEAAFGEETLTALNIQAAQAWPGFAEALEAAAGRTIGYMTHGTLLVAVDTSDRAVTDDLLGYRAQLGFTAAPLTSRECRALEPLLAPGIRGGADLVGDHQVDNRRLVDALVAACRAGRVELVEDEVSAVEAGAGRALGVTLRHGGRRPAGAVVVAAGCHSGRLGGIPALMLPPVRPVKGLTLRLRAPDDAPVLRRTVRGLVHGRNCYLVPRADRTVVIGATVEERGFDLAVLAGAVSDLLDDARRLVPSLEEYELADTTTGLRPGSPDNGPIVGPTGLPGLLVATGHYRNGILLAPVTAAEVVRLLRADGRGGAEGPFARFGPD